MTEYSIPQLGVCRVRADGFAADLRQTAAGETQRLTLTLSADVPTAPQDASVCFDVFVPDVVCVWSPDYDDRRAIRPDWGRTRVRSRSASGAPIACLLAQNGENRLTVSLSDASDACSIAVGICEETGQYSFVISCFTQLTSPLQTYRVDLRLDWRRLAHETVIADVRRVWDELYPPCRVPDAAREPLYSCWYSMHQQVLADDVLRQSALAAPYGMRTVIIDDGWETEDNNRGYAFCGDWKLATKKIPDMAALADAVHALGMRLMIWYSVPFIGECSENFERFRGMYLSHDTNLRCYTLDPRFPQCRAFLCETYLTAVREWRLDGLKLDFIDSFRLTETSPQNDARMDYISLEDAVQALLREVTAALRAENPDVLIEFRQSYTGPVMRQFGNMLRVGDCPGAAAINRMGSVTLRLLCGETAVHSDMVMWHPDESAETAADQLTAILYCVPQISVRLETLPQRHREMLAFYLRFWREKRQILLDGTLTAEHPEAGYLLVRAERDGEAVITTYLPQCVSLRGLQRGTVVNASSHDALLLETDGTVRYRVLDCTGRPVGAGEEAALARVPVPHSGMIEFEIV